MKVISLGSFLLLKGGKKKKKGGSGPRRRFFNSPHGRGREKGKSPKLPGLSSVVRKNFNTEEEGKKVEAIEVPPLHDEQQASGGAERGEGEIDPLFS